MVVFSYHNIISFILEKPIKLGEPEKQQCKEKAFRGDKCSFEEA
jgi:hypothetical protein